MTLSFANWLQEVRMTDISPGYDISSWIWRAENYHFWGLNNSHSILFVQITQVSSGGQKGIWLILLWYPVLLFAEIALMTPCFYLCSKSKTKSRILTLPREATPRAWYGRVEVPFLMCTPQLSHSCPSNDCLALYMLAAFLSTLFMITLCKRINFCFYLVHFCAP